MKYRKLTSDNDFSFGNNEQDYIDGISSISQAIRTKVLLFFGEWWENTGIGIPMFQSIIGQMNPEAIKMSTTLLVTQRVMQVPYVQSVNNVDVKINRDTREMVFVLDVSTTLGDVSVEVS